jgi:retinoblastoma-associated protein
VLELLVAHAPTEGRDGSVASILGDVPTAIYPMEPTARTKLHAVLKAQSDQVDKFLPEMGKLVAELRATLGLQPGATGTWSGGIAGFLADAGNLESIVEKLEARYLALATRSRQPFDDRFFFSAPMPAPVAPSAQDGPSIPAQPMSPQRASVGTPKHSNALFTPLRGANPLAAPHTPMNMQTPISGHFDCVSWLRAAVAGVSADSPSESLSAFFVQCEPDPADAIKTRLDRLCGLLSDRLHSGELDSEIGEQLALGRQLYYKMLLSFLEAEELRLQNKSFARTLLVQDIFHTALFACCMEAVFASFLQTDLAFPGVIDALQLKAFDFYKVIEGFVRNEPELPKYLRRHFRDLEVKVLEALAWADDSPLHALTREYDQQTSPTGSAAGPARAKAALSSFLKKVEYVAATRVHDMCTRLLLRTPLVVQVWECLKAVIQTPDRHLLTGRHLDQIIMCTIYGVCKVNKRPDEESKTFRHIIEQYKRQEKASAKVFREVRMASAHDPPQDIIAFYNKIFIPNMKDNLLRVLKEVTEERGTSCSRMASSPLAPSGSVARSMASPQRVIGGRDVWISHPRTPSGSMTPRTRTLYAFGDSPGGNLGRLDSLQRVNHQLNSGPTDGSVAANALRALSTTPSRASTPSRTSPSVRSGLMPAPPPEIPSRKRSLESGGMSRKQLQRRLNDDVAIPERSSSHGSNGSSSPEGGAAHSNGSA